MADGGVSKCGRKAALSTFFTVTFIAFTLSVISLISPSWQYVYLENGRTEHQHGLWLDCKRDFSFDYGRTREYYETLYRRDFQGSPFDIFFLPPLQCVYKFDYYIDPEDLYDHNHDENRIQNDAYQHLFLGSMNTLEWNQSQRTASGGAPPARTAQQFALPAIPKLKSALKTPQPPRKSVNTDDSDITYECLPCDVSAGVSSLLGGRPTSSLRAYDPVYEQIGQENYLEPNSIKLRSNMALNLDQDKKALLPTQPLPGSSQSIPVAHQKTTVIDDVVRPSSLVEVHREGATQTDPAKSSSRTVEEMGKTELFRRFAARNEPATPSTKPAAPRRDDKPPLSIRDFGISPKPKNGYCDVETTFDGAGPSSASSSRIKYTELDKGPDGLKPTPATPIKYISVERSSVERLRELAGRPSTSIDERTSPSARYEDRPKTSSNNDSFDTLPLAKAGIAINTFGDRSKQRSITNLTFRPHSRTGASEVFERPDSVTLETAPALPSTPRKPPQPMQQMVLRKLLKVVPDEVDRSVGSSTMVENEVMRDCPDSYVRDAEIRLNLFMNDVTKDETTV
ncbi:hypothetical protein GCK32_011431 [Trichostrongylus colubriformis]|uniref:Uncharacterized protein n=1 Tax=Trichostrongylus colubriformis TaxID=6319 RepID=A0AAN8FMW6_TRICO